jgi:serine/threonine-protein kinase
METKRLKHYQVKIKPIGSGQFSHVCWAKNLNNNKEVAIKSSSHLNTSKKEAKIMKKYGNHSYLPKFYDYFLVDDRSYIVMEYFPGETLGPGNHTRQGKKMNRQQAVQVTLNALQGLKQLHQIGFTHNDLLPKNILIKDDNPNQMRVIDFGIARPLSSSKSQKYKNKDLRLAALTCLYLISGPVSKTPTEDLNSLTDDKLKQVLANGINHDLSTSYQTAEEFIKQLSSIS